MGPLYHLHNANDRSKSIQEAMRVLKKDGTIFVSFINHDMVHMTELRDNNLYFKNGDYDHTSMRLHDFPFVFFTVPECNNMLRAEGIQIEKIVASDGASELMSAEINAMDEESYSQYLCYHFYRCEKPELLGFTNHLLFIGKM
jgi:SAM-dependent methyltransferase